MLQHYYFPQIENSQRIIERQGICPSIPGISQPVVYQDLLKDHKELEATNALQPIMNTKAPTLIKRTLLGEGMVVTVSNISSRHNEEDVWVEATIQTTKEYMLICHKSSKGLSV